MGVAEVGIGLDGPVKKPFGPLIVPETDADEPGHGEDFGLLGGQLERGVDGVLGATQIIGTQPDPGQVDMGLHEGRVCGQGLFQVLAGRRQVEVGQVHQGQGDQGRGGFRVQGHCPFGRALGRVFAVLHQGDLSQQGLGEGSLRVLGAGGFQKLVGLDHLAGHEGKIAGHGSEGWCRLELTVSLNHEIIGLRGLLLAVQGQSQAHHRGFIGRLHLSKPVGGRLRIVTLEAYPA